MYQQNTRMQLFLQAAFTPAEMEKNADTPEVVRHLNYAMSTLSPDGVQAVWLAGRRNSTYLMYDGQMVTFDYDEVAWDDIILQNKKTVVSEPYWTRSRGRW